MFATRTRSRGRAELREMASIDLGRELLEVTIAKDGVVVWDAFERKLAERLLQAEIANWGWLLDLGFWGPAPYRKEAKRIASELRAEPEPRRSERGRQR